MSGGVSAATIFAGIGAGVSILGAVGAFGGGESRGQQQQAQLAPPPAPTLTPPTVMPTPDDAAVKAAQRRSISGQAARRGRESTILATGGDSGDLLGG